MSDASSDELVSQFMAFSGCTDGERAQSYLEMSGGNVEVAVSLYMEHQGGGAGGASAPQVRAPDQTRTMRLMDEVGGMGHPMGPMGPMGPGYQDLNDAIMSSFANIDARAAVNRAASAAQQDLGGAIDVDDDDDAMHMGGEDDIDVDDDDEENKENGAAVVQPKLSDLFAPPTHLMFRGRGGFQGARTAAKESKRWLLVNLQRDAEFSSHALNRDVWRDELVENLVREGFIFWQALDSSEEGQVYSQRYKVHQYPHVAIIDPRTGRLLWRKEGWTQEKPFGPESFAEMAMDFCSKHSFDKDAKVPLKPKAPPQDSSSASVRKTDFMTEEEQLQAAMAASLGEKGGNGAAATYENDDEEDYIMDDSDDDDGVEYLGTQEEMREAMLKKEEEEKKPPSLIETLLSIQVGDEPSDGARIQLRMPDAKRIVRRFTTTDPVKTLYAFVAQNNEEAKGGKTFSMMAGFPPKDLEPNIDKTIGESGLAGEAITVRWKSS